MYKYPEKTILQQPFSPRYKFCRSHAWELCFVLHQAHSPHTQLFGHHSARKQLNTEGRGWGPAAFHDCGCTTEEMSLLDFPSGGREAIPFQQGLTQWGEKADDHHLTWRSLFAYFGWGTPQQHLLGPTAPGTAPGLTCIKGCNHLKTLVPCQQNQKILVCMKGNKAPITVRKITIIHPIFFSGLSPQLSWWCRQTAEVHVQIAKL